MAQIPSLSLSCFPCIYGQKKAVLKKKSISLPSKVGREILAWNIGNGQKGVLPMLSAPFPSISSFV